MKTMTNSEFPPIACTLGLGDFKDRIGWIRELSAKSLRSHRRDKLMLELTYDPSAAADVHELVRREQACCGFLRFDVRESAHAVHLTTITAPPEAQSAADDDLFAHFVA
jgi:hypothetical protein